MTFVDALDINTFWVVLSVIEHPVVPILLDVIPGAQETQKGDQFRICATFAFSII